MQIAILSRSKNLYSVRRLREEAKKARLQCEQINPLHCQLVIMGEESKILYGTKELPFFDAVIPRIGASITSYGLSVVRHFEMQGMFTVNSAQAIAESRNKMRSLQVLAQAGILVPSTVLAHTTAQHFLAPCNI